MIHYRKALVHMICPKFTPLLAGEVVVVFFLAQARVSHKRLWSQAHLDLRSGSAAREGCRPWQGTDPPSLHLCFLIYDMGMQSEQIPTPLLLQTWGCVAFRSLESIRRPSKQLCGLLSLKEDPTRMLYTRE